MSVVGTGVLTCNSCSLGLGLERVKGSAETLNTKGGVDGGSGVAPDPGRNVWVVAALERGSGG